MPISRPATPEAIAATSAIVTACAAVSGCVIPFHRPFLRQDGRVCLG